MENIVGSLRINQKDYKKAFITCVHGGLDILIDGVKNRNSALDGDVVQVKLNNYDLWQINYNAIATKWDLWSKDLQPLLDHIELVDKFTSAIGEVDRQNAKSPTETEAKVRNKRDVNKSTNDGCNKVSPEIDVTKLPSNLPPGILKLKLKQLISLPFSSYCIQRTGRVIEVVKRRNIGIAGGLLRPYDADKALFSPLDSRIPRMLIPLIECPNDLNSKSTRYKDVLFVGQIISWSPRAKFAEGSLIRIVGDCNSYLSRIESLLMENQIYDQDFPPEVYQELEYLNNLPKNWLTSNSKSRRDLTKECVITIDPKTARDLDDAVSIRQISEQIYEVGVHIADVSHFVKENTAVDYHARARTTSVYLVDRVIPMLPRVLCEQMCSLNPNQPKLTFSVLWKMDKYGRIIDQWFGKTIIKSCTKLAYEHAQDIIDNKGDLRWIEEGVNMPKLYGFNWKQVSNSVIWLNKIAENLRAKRFDGGALRIEQAKLKFELDSENGFPIAFSLEERTPSNFLIEEFMLLANMAVAKRIYDYSSELAFLRRHPPSSSSQMQEIKDFCDAKGIGLDISSAGSIQRSLNSISDPTMKKVLSHLLLKTMKNAEYICVGSLGANDLDGFRHYALNVPFYTHFTSPIRRYADLIVHRILGNALGYERYLNDDLKSLTLLADECTLRKVSSKLLSTTSQKLYFNLFVQKAGHCEMLACINRILDKSFDAILVDFDYTGRVYLNNLKPQPSCRFESTRGVKRLILEWDSPSTGPEKAVKKRRSRKKNLQTKNTQDTGSNKLLSESSKMHIKEVVDNRLSLEVFDVIKVIITVDPNDITQLKFGLKTPFQQK